MAGREYLMLGDGLLMACGDLIVNFGSNPQVYRAAMAAQLPDWLAVELP